MATWALLDIDRNLKNHVVSVTFREIADDGKTYDYRITLPQGSTRLQYLAKLKEEVLAARARRSRLDTLRATIDPDQIEAFINS